MIVSLAHYLFIYRPPLPFVTPPPIVNWCPQLLLSHVVLYPVSLSSSSHPAATAPTPTASSSIVATASTTFSSSPCLNLVWFFMSTAPKHRMQCHCLVMQEGDSAERNWCPFINQLPEILEVLGSDSCCSFSTGHLREGIMCLLQNLLCPNVSVWGIVISSLEDLLSTICVPHETKVIK